MKQLIFTYIALSLTCVLTTVVKAGPAPKPPQEVIVVNDASSPVLVKAKSYRYVGNYSTRVLPNIGISGMHKVCQEGFGPNARMCTTTEVFETPNMPATSQQAWVQPIISASFVTDTHVYYVVDGIALPEQILGGISGMNCHSWRDDSVSARGAIIHLMGLG